MRKITKEYNVYGFEELDKSIQESILERYVESEIEIYCETCLYGDMVELAHNLLQEYFKGSEYMDIHYDLDYSQGSGAMMEFDINIKDLNNKYKIFSDNEIELLNNKYVVSDIRIRHNNNFYCHEYTFGIDCDFYMGLEYDDIKEDYKITENEFNTIENRLYDLLDDSNKHYTKSPFIKDIINMNKEFTKSGYRQLEDREMFEENAMLYIKDLEFLESGEEFYV
jgi:hypothetical protein